MKHILYSTILLIVPIFVFAQSTDKSIQIKTAVTAAPDEMRENATVYGYDDNGDFILLRNGSNEMICLADDPGREGINIACYHKDLEPFMQRGRELKAEGLGNKDIFDTREKEVQEGKLKMPDHPTTLHILYGPNEILDTETGEFNGEKIRYVVYIPYATPESSGLPDRPLAPGAPWIMDPGTHRAHIMITPVN